MASQQSSGTAPSSIALRPATAARTVAAPAQPTPVTTAPKHTLNPTRNDLPADARVKLVALLQGRLVDAIDLYLQAKGSHWNVKGPTFIALHELFDKVAGEAEACADLLAERAVQLGGTPDGSAAAIDRESSLAAAPLAFAGEADHVEAVADALATFGQAARAAIERADKLEDKTTADLFTEISRGVDKLTWFVESHLHAE